MDNFYLFILILFYVLLTNINTVVSEYDSGNCGRPKRLDHGGNVLNYTEWFCCTHFERKDDNCIACKKGFSSNGIKCQPCGAGHYGYKCADACRCQDNQTCDNVDGCVNSLASTVNIAETTPKTQQSDANGYVIVYMCSVAGIGLLLVVMGAICKFRHRLVSFKGPFSKVKLIWPLKAELRNASKADPNENKYGYYDIDENAMIDAFHI